METVLNLCFAHRLATITAGGITRVILREEQVNLLRRQPAAGGFRIQPLEDLAGMLHRLLAADDAEAVAAAVDLHAQPLLDLSQVRIELATRQPTMRRAKTSMTKATKATPAQVAT